MLRRIQEWTHSNVEANMACRCHSHLTDVSSIGCDKGDLLERGVSAETSWWRETGRMAADMENQKGVREKEGLSRALGSETHKEIIWVAGVAHKGGTLV